MQGWTKAKRSPFYTEKLPPKCYFFAQLFDAACPVQAATKCLGGLVFHGVSRTFRIDIICAVSLKKQYATEEEEERMMKGKMNKIHHGSQRKGRMRKAG